MLKPVEAPCPFCFDAESPGKAEEIGVMELHGMRNAVPLPHIVFEHAESPIIVNENDNGDIMLF